MVQILPYNVGGQHMSSFSQIRQHNNMKLTPLYALLLLQAIKSLTGIVTPGPAHRPLLTGGQAARAAAAAPPGAAGTGLRSSPAPPPSTC